MFIDFENLIFILFLIFLLIGIYFSCRQYVTLKSEGIYDGNSSIQRHLFQRVVKLVKCCLRGFCMGHLNYSELCGLSCNIRKYYQYLDPVRYQAAQLDEEYI